MTQDYALLVAGSNARVTESLSLQSRNARASGGGIARMGYWQGVLPPARVTFTHVTALGNTPSGGAQSEEACEKLIARGAE